MIETFWNDVRHAGRALRRRPLVTTAAVVSLALGIGINTAIFSVFERLVLRQLPVHAPEEIVLITSPGPRPGGTSTGDSGPREQTFSYPLFRDLERLRLAPLSSVVAHRDFAAHVRHGGETARVEGLLVSGGYFSVLGIPAAQGRLLTRDDDAEGAPPAVVLAYRYWVTQFDADPHVIGQSVVVNATPMTVVGVAPDGFDGTTIMDAPEIFAPLAMTARLHAGSMARDSHWLYLFARLAPGASPAQAEAALNGPFHALIRDVELPALRTAMDESARTQFLSRRIVIADGARYRSSNRDEARVIIGLLLTVTGLVLLIACANVANLLLTRAAEREGEIGIRASLGASAIAIVRMLLAESVLLGVLASACALAMAWLGTMGLVRLLPASDGAVLQFEVNRAILLFTVGVGLGTGLLFGLVPAWHAVRARGAVPSPASSGRVSVSRRGARVRTSLVTAQVALATALVAEAGLFALSLAHVSHEALGFRTDEVVTFRVSPNLNGYTAEQARTFFDRVADELRRGPGVMDVSASTNPVLSDDAWTQAVTVGSTSDARRTSSRVNAARVGEAYFRTLGIPMLAGRDFARTDAAGSPQVAIVNRAFTREFHLGDEAVGHRLALGQNVRSVLDIEIVGVVADAKYKRVRDAAPAQVFLPYRQIDAGTLTFYARTTDRRALLSAAPAIVARLDPNVPLEHLETMDDQVWENVTGDRVLATLSSLFASLALVLAAVGLYAVLAYLVAQRAREIGIRIALGATGRDVRRLLLAYIGRVAVLGMVIGLALAAGLGRFGAALFVGVQSGDPRILGTAVGFIAIVIMATSLHPMRRAASIDPAAALRAD
jgi:predicted permease